MNKRSVTTYNFKGTKIGFDPTGKVLMVNLSHMESKFKKKLDDFLKLKSTEQLIGRLVEQQRNSLAKDCKSYSGLIRAYLKGQDDVIKVVEKTKNAISQGTWGNAPLAIKFAEWLDASFGDWMKNAIRKIYKESNVLLSDIDGMAEYMETMEMILRVENAELRWKLYEKMTSHFLQPKRT